MVVLTNAVYHIKEDWREIQLSLQYLREFRGVHLIREIKAWLSLNRKDWRQCRDFNKKGRRGRCCLDPQADAKAYREKYQEPLFDD